MTSLRVGLLGLLCVGCFKPQGKPDGDSSDTGASSAATTAAGTTMGTDGAPTTGVVATASGPMTATDATTADPSAGTTTGEAVCGDGDVQAGEDCDDGNVIGGDRCPAMCKFGCGDGVLDDDETCDDGNAVDGDGCSQKCLRDALFVFVTAQMFPADLGGLDGADKICQQRAIAGGLSGTYRAWLSDDVTSAITRIPGGKLPYLRLDGMQVATNLGVIIGAVEQKLQLPITVTELKDELLKLSACGGADAVWTGTTALGTGDPGANCGNWNEVNSPLDAVGGSLQAIDAKWTEGCGLMCNGGARLYCFEIEG
jgi:cysteine-rich repeat protein